MTSRTIEDDPATDARYRLSEDQVRAYETQGYVTLDGVFDDAEVAALRDANDRLVDDLTRKHTDGPIKTTEHVFSSGTWAQVVRDARLVTPVSQLIGPNVEFHHTNARKYVPAEHTRRELHQDRVFYPHETTQFVNALIYLDDFPESGGTMRFVPGSHEAGDLDHVEGDDGLPRIPTDVCAFEESEAVPASAGDVLLMHINVVHGSDIDRATSGSLAWVGYNDPANRQLSGQAADRQGFMVSGHRP